MCGGAALAAAHSAVLHLVSACAAQISLHTLAPRRYRINNFVTMHPLKAFDAAVNPLNWP